MEGLVKKILKEDFDGTMSEFKDEIFDLSFEERKSILRGLETLATIKDSDSLEEQINYKGIPEMRAKTTFGKIIKWFKRYITDKATNFLINASMNEIKDTILLKMERPGEIK